jgi:hypothetical protein
MVDTDVVSEVMSDLAIKNLPSDSQFEAAGIDSQYRPAQNVTGMPDLPGDCEEISTPARAAAYMQQIALS